MWKYSVVLSFLDPLSRNMESSDRDEQTPQGLTTQIRQKQQQGYRRQESQLTFWKAVSLGPLHQSPSSAAASPAQAGPSSSAAVPTVPPTRRRRRPREEPINFEKELLAALKSRPQPPPCSKDEHFLLSLLPSLQKLKKEFVKFQIHKLIYESSTVLLNLETLEPKE
ncbi:hypothetical protein ABG768_019108 [Culter alburnus]|uniref:BESS domain-containing protein n=1 Tax=Culter alburnus TaxID=194366 RepID=A0AAW2AX33_CULAL